MTFDPNKPYHCRNGWKAEILRTNVKNGNWPIVALVTNSEGDELAHIFTAAGKCYNQQDDHGFDLVNIPEEKVVYVNIYPGGILGEPRDSLEATKRVGGCANVGVLKITLIEGQKPKVEVL